jgi:hypothetical protein
VRGLAAWLGALAAAVALGSAVQAQTASVEYAVKATYLYKFAPFVEWPASAFPSPSSPFYLCVLGSDPFGPTLDAAVSGQRVDAHPVQVVRLQKVEAASRCHVLYLGASRAQSAAEALAAVRGKPVLTVGEQAGAAPGAVIRFVLKQNRVRFDIDTGAAAANGMAISSRLLALANSVKGGPAS